MVNISFKKGQLKEVLKRLDGIDGIEEINFSDQLTTAMSINISTAIKDWINERSKNQSEFLRTAIDYQLKADKKLVEILGEGNKKIISSSLKLGQVQDIEDFISNNYYVSISGFVRKALLSYIRHLLEGNLDE